MELKCTYCGGVDFYSDENVYICADCGLELQKIRCNRCGYEWHPKTTAMPKHCANKGCNSPYWNKERQRKR